MESNVVFACPIFMSVGSMITNSLFVYKHSASWNGRDRSRSVRTKAADLIRISNR
ncbi:hypothetical protein T440DRAFT_467927 [Plenodomus tracheiphilus IPT5]|uniref:Uncharacterized protein n=1 Tax=Plenodomus tracheiphilus IPT5 TaxID=1408161 RepID=A0A6A7B7C7_9PLEO|nr:hypothetical protein T440DRAFT_467927 [Plenodomus tracheiphilus IPT5]